MINLITVLHFPQGRLGNIFFQLVAANEAMDTPVRVVTFASEATDYFNWDENFLIIPCPKYLRARLIFIWICFLRLLCALKIVGTIKPELIYLPNGFSSEGINVKTQKGLISNIYILMGFFQHDRYKKLKPKVKKNMMNYAEFKLKSIPKQSRVAVHLRFKDYTHFSIYGNEGAELHLSYYLKAFALMEQYVESPDYIVFSDDLERAKVIMEKTQKKFNYHSEGDPVLDLVAMSTCSHAIVSASSFAWWGAELINNPSKIIIAPKYWLGFKSKCWFPLQIKTAGFKYVSAQ